MLSTPDRMPVPASLRSGLAPPEAAADVGGRDVRNFFAHARAERLDM
jgi:hypothetical protein